MVLICVGLGCKSIGKLGKINYFEGDNAKIASDAVRETIGKPVEISEIYIFGSIFSALEG